MVESSEEIVDNNTATANNRKEEPPTPDVAVRILEFQRDNKDEPVPGTTYSTYFIDVQLKSLLTHPDGFYPELFKRLLNIAADRNVCAWIWSRYQDLFVELVHKLDSVEEYTDENLPGFAPYLLKIIARVLFAQVDVKQEANETAKIEETLTDHTQFENTNNAEKRTDPPDRNVTDEPIAPEEGKTIEEKNPPPGDDKENDDNDADDRSTLDEMKEDLDEPAEEDVFDGFKATFKEVELDFYKLFSAVTKLLAVSCPQTLSGCLRIIIELMHRPSINYEEVLMVVESEPFMAKLHFIMVCSMNDDLLESVGEFLKNFSYTFAEDFPLFLPLIKGAMEMRESKPTPGLMDGLVCTLLQIEPWPMDTKFYEYLNTMTTKLNQLDRMTAIGQRFHERLKIHNQAIYEARLKAK